MKGSILSVHCGLLLLLMYVVVPNMAVVVSVRCCAQLNFQQSSENLFSTRSFQYVSKFHQVFVWSTDLWQDYRNNQSQTVNVDQISGNIYVQSGAYVLQYVIIRLALQPYSVHALVTFESPHLLNHIWCAPSDFTPHGGFRSTQALDDFRL